MMFGFAMVGPQPRPNIVVRTHGISKLVIPMSNTYRYLFTYLVQQAGLVDEERQCLVCFGSDEDDPTAALVHPCR